ncbi:MAG: hypothetical protein ACLT0Y_05525 [Christensenellales bacterium]
MNRLKKIMLACFSLAILALCVGCGSSNELIGRYQDTQNAEVVYDFQKKDVFAIETSGDEISTGGLYTVDEEAKRLHFEMQAPGGEKVTLKLPIPTIKKIKPDHHRRDGTQQVMKN